MTQILKNIIYMARRFKTATVLNMIGLIVAFASFYLLMTQILYQINYNHGLKDHERLYRLESDELYDEWEFSDNISRPFADALKGMPQVECYSLAMNITNNEMFFSYPFKKGDQQLMLKLTIGNNEAVSALTDKVIDGSIEWTDDDQEGLIIPASIARQYFGTTQASGKKMVIEGIDETFNVRGVYEDFPENSEPWNCIYKNIEDNYTDDFNGLFKCIIKFKDVPEDLDAFAQEVKLRVIEATKRAQTNNTDSANVIKSVIGTRLNFTPIDNTYFEYSSFTSGDTGYKGMFLILELTCLLVIIIAAINFLNFTLAESPMRVRSLNTRLVLGAERRRLRLSLVTECVVTAIAACIIALLLVYLSKSLPVIRSITEGNIALSTHKVLIPLLFALSVVVGIAAGTYPAVFATSFPPAIALKGTFGLTPRGRKLRMVLVCLQLSVSMLMGIYIAILYQQSRFIYNSSYGYDKNQVLTSTSSLDLMSGESLYNDLIKIPGVEAVAYSDNRLGVDDGHNTLTTEMQGQTIRYCYMRVSQNYMRAMGIDIVTGRDFEPTDTMAVIVNKAALKKWDWLNPGARVAAGFGEYSGDTATVVGICENIRYGTTRVTNNEPFFFIYDPSKECYCLNVRVATDVNQETVRRRINEVMKEHCGSDFSEAVYFNQNLEKVYENEFRYMNQIILISIICIIITLIGVFCITMFETEYRRKEIGIRKVSGATTGEIIRMLCRHYVILILVSFVITSPLAYYLGRLTLRYFNQHTDIDWWLFPLALLLVGGITLGTVVLQSWRVARENPVLSIKTE